MATPHVPSPYTILMLGPADRQLTQLQKTHNRHVRSIIAAVMSLAENPRPASSRKLVNRPELRLRVGDYRILYLVDDGRRTVTVSAIAHRRDVYR